MAEITDPNIPRIIYSRISKKTMEGELFIRQHVFDYIISGCSEVFLEGKSHTFKAGDFRFAVRNRLSRFIKLPPTGGEYLIRHSKTTLIHYYHTWRVEMKSVNNW